MPARPSLSIARRRRAAGDAATPRQHWHAPQSSTRTSRHARFALTPQPPASPPVLCIGSRLGLRRDGRASRSRAGARAFRGLPRVGGRQGGGCARAWVLVGRVASAMSCFGCLFCVFSRAIVLGWDASTIAVLGARGPGASRVARPLWPRRARARGWYLVCLGFSHRRLGAAAAAARVLGLRHLHRRVRVCRRRLLLGRGLGVGGAGGLALLALDELVGE